MLICKTLHCDMLHVQFVNGIHGNVLNCLGRKYSCMNLSDNNAAVTICSSYTAKSRVTRFLVPGKNRVPQKLCIMRLVKKQSVQNPRKIL